MSIARKIEKVNEEINLDLKKFGVKLDFTKYLTDVANFAYKKGFAEPKSDKNILCSNKEE